MLINDVADSPRMPERPAIKSRTAFIFGPSNELTNDEPTLDPVTVPPALPSKPLSVSDQPPCGDFCFNISRRPVAPPGDEACAAVEPSSAGNAYWSALFVPSGFSPTDLLNCPRISGDNCSLIIFRIFMKEFPLVQRILYYPQIGIESPVGRSRPLPTIRPRNNSIPGGFYPLFSQD